jgi:hypothetical protein
MWMLHDILAKERRKEDKMKDNSKVGKSFMWMLHDIPQKMHIDKLIASCQNVTWYSGEKNKNIER